MSIENNLAVIAKSLERIATAMEQRTTAAPTPATQQQVLGAAVQAAAVATAPVASEFGRGPFVAESAPPSTTMPAGPNFMTPAAPTVATNVVPFTDGKGLVAYVMDAYKTMGPEKGAGIQGVLGSLGYQNINDVKPEHYADLYSKVEALKL